MIKVSYAVLHIMLKMLLNEAVYAIPLLKSSIRICFEKMDCHNHDTFRRIDFISTHHTLRYFLSQQKIYCCKSVCKQG